MFRVPMAAVPLNIMCSKRCATPVMPGRSWTDPTLATQPAATFGSPGRGKSSNVKPLSSTTSSTGTCCAPAVTPTHTAASASAPMNVLMLPSNASPAGRPGRIPPECVTTHRPSQADPGDRAGLTLHYESAP